MKSDKPAKSSSAPKKGRVVFTHKLDALPRQLFFVLERPSGELVIVISNEQNLGTPRRKPNIFYYDGTFNPSVTTRISVHNSSSSTGMLLKLTHEFKDRSIYVAPCFISNAKEKLCHLLFAKLYPQLQNPRYNPSRPNDEQCEAGHSRVSDNATLCLAVLLLDNHSEIPELSWAGRAIRRFEKYTLVAYFAFLNITPNNFGLLQTSKTERDGIGAGGILSMEPDQVSGRILSTFEDLAASRIEQEIFTAEDFRKELLRNHRIYFFRRTIDLHFDRITRIQQVM